MRDLRRRIGAAGVVTIRGGYRLDVPRESVDAECFEELVRARRYGEALALWHGSALVEWAEQPWARAVAIRLEEQRLAALESRLAQDIDAGLSSAVIAELTALVDEHPFRERLRVLLIKALYATGRQAEALQAYAHARRCLIDELGLEPGPELRATEAAVLAHDPALDVAPARPGAAPPVPATPLTGRIRELATIRSALTVARLVTPLRTSGVGKSRLAVEVASRLSPPAGAVWFVNLAPASATGVAMTVARALQLAEFLVTKSISSATTCIRAQACSFWTRASASSRSWPSWPPNCWHAVATCGSLRPPARCCGRLASTSSR